MVARIGVAFGMDVLVWGREGSLDRARAEGFNSLRTRRHCSALSDVLSLHLRLNAETTGVIGPEDLALMKPTALLVNTSRAELIEPGAFGGGVAGWPPRKSGRRRVRTRAAHQSGRRLAAGSRTHCARRISAMSSATIMSSPTATPSTRSWPSRRVRRSTSTTPMGKNRDHCR